ncbi:PREDICTED: protein STRUBBELIG [Tarenaya hassleriana]|uniref:protein STRUBBELIG n=1 Tax=Tarenaya hassleriana TaxID=28532 RepID=UPI00053CA1AE|nr:PREDICTED: protein STRUBBELIG [Tarenaya hassleriana]
MFKVMSFTRWGVFVVFCVLASTVPFSAGITNLRDVSAINNLYITLGSPPLSGWLDFGGDPCGEGWQGVICDSANITEIRISGLNVGGSLSDTLSEFTSIQVMDFSSNRIGGSIPRNLPYTIRNLSLSGNQFTGSIPFTISYLSQLSDLSLGNNLLTGSIPDIFQQLSELTKLDMSANQMTGKLPSSMRDLLSLKTLHLQNNKLIGTLDVLEDLPLTDLNVENNLFSGPIPPKLLNIPNFKKDGTPFNTTIITPPPPGIVPPPPSSRLPPVSPLPPASPSPPLVWPPPTDDDGESGDPFNGVPSSGQPTLEISTPSGSGKFWTTQKIILIVASVAIILLVSGLCFSLWRCCRSKKSYQYDAEAFKENVPNRSNKPSSLPVASDIGKVPREPMVKPFDGYGADNRKNGSQPKPQVMAAGSGYKTGNRLPPQKPLPRPPMHFRSNEAAERVTRFPPGMNSSSSATVFTIASLQQYTNSFAERNIIGEGSLGNIYRAELPEGKLLAVKKLTATQTDSEFLNLVSSVIKLKHGNILELFGYCNEYDQRLLVYEYCPNGSLYDALHVNRKMQKKITWNIRIKLALGASRALQFLHEVCQPPIVHQNLKSSKVLLDEKFSVRVSDSGLAHLLPPRSTSQMAGYAAPEVEYGSYTCQSDVYSLGVVMLELLTGRKPYDRTRPRGQQSLAQWAIPQLHDIDALTRMVDPSLNGAYPMKSLSRFADIISRSLQIEPGFRPPVSELVQDLLHMI